MDSQPLLRSQVERTVNSNRRKIAKFDVARLVAVADWAMFRTVWFKYGAKDDFDVYQSRREVRVASIAIRWTDAASGIFAPWHRRTALQLAVMRRAPAWVIEELLSNPNVVRATITHPGSLHINEYKGCTPLELAIADRDVFSGTPELFVSTRNAERSASVIRVLLAHGASLSLSNSRSKRNALHHAAKHGAPVSVVLALLTNPDGSLN